MTNRYCKYCYTPSDMHWSDCDRPDPVPQRDPGDETPQINKDFVIGSINGVDVSLPKPTMPPLDWDRPHEFKRFTDYRIGHCAHCGRGPSHSLHAVTTAIPPRTDGICDPVCPGMREQTDGMKGPSAPENAHLPNHAERQREWVEEIVDSAGNAAPSPAEWFGERKDTNPKGAKFDDGKADVALLFDYFAPALLAVAQVSEYGMRKYADSNSTGSGWQDVLNGLQRYAAAGGRHDLKRRIEGEYDDGDSGLSHRAQKAWNALAELTLALRDGVVENRRGNDIEFVDGKPRPILGTAKKV